MKKKSIKDELISCFYRGNRALYCVAVIRTLFAGTLNLIVS